jgi:hypothetical protein
MSSTPVPSQGRRIFCGQLPVASAQSFAQFVVGEAGLESFDWIAQNSALGVTLDHPVILLLMPVVQQNRLTQAQQFGTAHQYVVDALCPVRSGFKQEFRLHHFLTWRFYDESIPEDKKLMDDYREIVRTCLEKSAQPKLT